MRPKLSAKRCFSVKVKTNAPDTAIIRYDEIHDCYLMQVHAKPVQGSANKEILRFLKKEFGWQSEIISGMNSTKKLIRINEESNTKKR